jgi:hypothetical protein
MVYRDISSFSIEEKESEESLREPAGGVAENKNPGRRHVYIRPFGWPLVAL